METLKVKIYYENERRVNIRNEILDSVELNLNYDIDEVDVIQEGGEYYIYLISTKEKIAQVDIELIRHFNIMTKY